MYELKDYGRSPQHVASAARDRLLADALAALKTACPVLERYASGDRDAADTLEEAASVLAAARRAGVVEPAP